MGFATPIESKNNEIIEFRRLLLSSADHGVHERRKTQSFHDIHEPDQHKALDQEEENEDELEKVVCVTSGLSLLGQAIVARLLSHGYSVRIAVDNQEEMNKLIEMELFQESRRNHNGIWGVLVKLTDIESLCEAFNGCRGVFHTSSFIDPAGVTGYTKYMAELEVKASENVMEACARTETVKKCVFTSSLLACVWRDHAIHDGPSNVDHRCWSEESVCRDKQLWFALGKTMAERAAWRMAADSDLKLATICPGLLTGPDSFSMNSLSSIPYLKGAQDMYAKGLLATTDVNTVAKAQVCIYESLGSTAAGRYICFNRVVHTEEEAIALAREIGLPYQRITSNTPTHSPARFSLCNRKLLRLMSKESHCT